MATATVAKPVQTLRQRRADNQRPSVGRSNTRAGTADTFDFPGSNIPEPLVHTPDYILQKHRGRPPSLVVHLHPTHFRFEQQDGNFAYNSAMAPFLKHIREGTVPHEMLEELLAADVPFYDGCLIVQIHDHKTTANASTSAASTLPGNTKWTESSIHNYNDYITPSSYTPFPRRSEKSNLQKIKTEVDKTGPGAVKDTDKENMPAPDQPASTLKKIEKSPKIFTKVLFPTPLSLNEEISILVRTPHSDSRGTKRQANGAPVGRDGATPTSAHPPTPLMSVPPTPQFNKGAPAKRQKMLLEGSQIHEFEAQVVNNTAPPLYLDPVGSFQEQAQLLEALKGPNQVSSAITRKTRKRTTAELAADEAQAADEERFMLVQDERIKPSLTAAASGAGGTSEGQTGTTEAPFSRFKTLENIKMRHEEAERQNREEEARQNMLRTQQQREDAEKRKELEARQSAAARRNQTEQQMLQAQAEAHAQQQLQNEQIRRQQAAIHARQQAQNAQAAAVAHAQGAQIVNHNGQHAHLQQSSGQQMSPVVRQQTPVGMNSSPVINGNIMSQPLTSVPMASSASQHGGSQGAGSPARPPSSISHHPQANPQPMGRQVSQQHQQPPQSANGTPRMMAANTPNTGQAIPAQVRNLTPVSAHRSPAIGAAQVNGMPMTTPQMHANNLTPQQVAMLRARQNAGMMGGSPHQMTPEQMSQIAAVQARQRNIQANQQVNGMNMGNSQQEQYRQQLINQRQMAERAQQQSLNNANGMSSSPMSGQAMPNTTQQNAAMQQQLLKEQWRRQTVQRYTAQMQTEVSGYLAQGRADLAEQVKAKYSANYTQYMEAQYRRWQQQRMMVAQRQQAANAASAGQGMNGMANGMANAMQGGAMQGGQQPQNGQMDPAYLEQMRQAQVLQQQREQQRQFQMLQQMQQQQNMQNGVQNGMQNGMQSGMGGFPNMNMQMNMGMGRGLQ